MNNPYHILGVPQNATKHEIAKGKILAMKARKYSLQEIALAEKQLLTPSKRLVADFMFPTRIKAKRPKSIITNLNPENIIIEDINENALNSLK